ncbi:MAG: rhomboid family intramembrane serine protease [Bdellovibrionaceae bacterium]|nr:rhomboid family intramembrane serine protease [Pseudobdellovibrionaceae bacterium]
MLFTLKQGLITQKEINDIYSDTLFLQTQGMFYSQYLNYNKALYKEETLELAKKAVVENDKEKLQILGSLGIRDQSFLLQINNFSFVGDDVLIDWWKEKLKSVQNMQSLHPSYAMGLNSSDITLSKWLTYQFVHSGFVHFLGNMLFLLIFGCMLEPILGGVGLLVSYLLSGMIAAGVFLFLSGVSSIPLIGASGAISGLMALFCIMFWNRSVRYIYFLFIPRRGYAGYVYLPGWITMAIWFLSDLAGYIGTADEFGGIAHTAHLGGELAGIIVGVIIYLTRMSLKKAQIPENKIPASLPVGTRIA